MSLQHIPGEVTKKFTDVNCSKPRELLKRMQFSVIKFSELFYLLISIGNLAELATDFPNND